MFLVVVLAAYAIIVAALFAFRGATGLEGVIILALSLLAGLLMVIWMAFLCGLPLLTRILGAVGLVALAAIVFTFVLRFDHFEGDMLPAFRFAWAPSPTERLRAHLAAEQAQPAGPSVDLTATSPSDFPGFLGKHRRGVVENVKLERDWAAHPPKELWRHPVGFGWSGFAVVGSAAITQEQREEGEAVVAYDKLTGKRLWQHIDERALFEETMGGNGPRATPLIDQGRVYTMGATGLLTCLDASGTKLWQHATLPSAAANLTWGMAGSPLAFENLIIVTPGVAPDHSITAYDAATGKEVWTQGDRPAAYGSPQYAKLFDVEQVLILDGAGLSSYEIRTGRPLWFFEWITQDAQRINTTQPIVLADWGRPEKDQIFISTGYGKGCAMLKLSYADGKFAVEELWSNANLRSKFADMVIRDEYLYGLDEGILCCLDLATGKRKWKGGRYGHGQLLLVGDLLLIQDEQGPVVLAEATPDGLKELGRIEALTQRTWNTLTLSGSTLIVRNDVEAAAYELPLAK